MYSIPEISRIASPIAHSYGINRLSVFGSYARGEATPRSDIDFRIVDDGSLRGLIRLAGFCRELEAALNSRIDVLTNDVLDDDFLNRIKDEEIIVYG
jgi:predicted nucleotidyltransferase